MCDFEAERSIILNIAITVSKNFKIFERLRTDWEIKAILILLTLF